MRTCPAVLVVQAAASMCTQKSSRKEMPPSQEEKEASPSHRAHEEEPHTGLRYLRQKAGQSRCRPAACAEEGNSSAEK